MSVPIKIFLTLLFLVAPAVAQSITSSSMNMTTSTSTSPEYTITALPAVKSLSPCIWNCLIPIGLADPSGCDDVTEDCACLSAPADVLGVLTGCIQTVCQSSTSAYAASATSLYESYCNSVYGTAIFTSAFSAEAATESSSSTSAEMTTTSTASSTTSASSLHPSITPSTSSTAKSGAITQLPSLFRTIIVFGSFISWMML